MSKKTEKKVKTVMLPGERGPEIQYRLTAFNQASKKKSPFQKPTKIQSTQISTKNQTTNVVHSGTKTDDAGPVSEKSKDIPKGDESPESSVISLKDTEEEKIQNIFKYKSKSSSEFCCASEKDTTGSWIAGIEFVQDGHIIILDTNNCKLKRFNTIYKLQSEIDVPVDCANLTQISNKEIAVSCFNEIHFYSVGHFGMSRSSKHFEVSGLVYGISNDNSRYAVTCDIEEENKCAIRILDIFGDEIHMINPKEADANFTLGPYCVIDSVARVVTVSDFDNRSVFCFNFNGSLKWKCEIDGGPRGLLKIGNDVMVSDNYGQEICAISFDSGKKKSYLNDEDGVFNPEFVACDHKNLRLIVTQRAFDTITVFNLTKL